MSQTGQKATFRDVRAMSAYPPGPDILGDLDVQLRMHSCVTLGRALPFIPLQLVLRRP